MKLKTILKDIWKYTKDTWKNPVGRTQFILLGVELIVIVLVFTFVLSPYYVVLFLLMLPISEELRMKHGYEIAKFIFPSQMKENEGKWDKKR